MSYHDEFDLDVRLGSGSSVAGSPKPVDGGAVTDTCQTCESCPAICGTDQTCAGQQTCDTCQTQCQQPTCADTCTCDTQCNQITCFDTCPLTCDTCDTCPTCPEVTVCPICIQ